MKPTREDKSTTGRTHVSPALHRAFVALEAVSPRLAARLAEPIFMTPPRPERRRDRGTVGAAEPFVVRSGASALRAWRLGAGPAVVLAHGWGGRGAQLRAFASPLVAAGASAVWFDGPAHGASSGRRTSIPRLADAIADVAAHVGARAVVAHSAGGAALALAVSRGLPLDAVVLVAPPRSPGAFVDAFSSAIGLGPRGRAALVAVIERRVGLRLDDLLVPRLARAFRLPALVIHDRADAEVPWECGAEIAAAWPGARLLTTDGLGHRRVLRDEGVVAEAAAFVVGRLPRCGCGRLASRVAAGAPRCLGCLLTLHLADREARAPGPAERRLATDGWPFPDVRATGAASVV